MREETRKFTTVEHTFEPVYNEMSKILILGSLPSVKSREMNFYYGHPQNRFWKLIAGLMGERLPVSIEDKKEMLLRNGIAVWDVIQKCDIIGSSDSSIRNVIPADINMVLERSSIKRLYANGGKAYELYMKYCYQDTKREIRKLPSSSPANAAYSLERLKEEWKRAGIQKCD